jgi:phosphatidate phosphatase APP1
VILEEEPTMWFLAFALALPMGEVKSEIKDDERVVFYPTYAHQVDDGRAWNLSIHGVIFEPEEGSLKRQAALSLLRRILRLSREQTETRIFKARARAFLVDNEGGKTITAGLGGRVYEAGTSGANGHFGAALKLPAAEIDRLRLADPDRPDWLAFEAVTRPDDRRTFTGQVRCIGPKGISVISDVDDTVKISMVTDRRALVRNTFLREFDAVDGMSELYRKWSGAGAAFHYLSGSPWQLYGSLSEFLHKEGFPPGSFHLKMFRLKDSSALNMLRSQRGYKSAAIERILADFPHRRFILVGDSSEEDPEIYAGAARKHGEQVLRIFIRRADASDDDPDRFRAAFEGLPPDRWQVFRDPQELADSLPPAQPPN